MEMDIIDVLVGIEPGSSLDAVRRRRPQARDQAQASYRALFSPEAVGGVSMVERFAVAAFVTALHDEAEIASFYANCLTESGAATELRTAIDGAVATAKGQGPYGSFPPGPLSLEDAPGPTYRIAAVAHDVLGPRLAAMFEHMHLLVFHPRDASPAKLQALLDAGWSTTDIVTLSQAAAFLSFQIRVVAGLRVLASRL